LLFPITASSDRIKADGTDGTNWHADRKDTTAENNALTVDSLMKPTDAFVISWSA